MDIHPNFATWLDAANITPGDEVLRKWWAGLESFHAGASDVVSLVQIAHVSDVATVGASRFYAALQKQDVALLPKDKLAIAVLAIAKLHTIMEGDSALRTFTALLSAVSFPIFEIQPAYRTELAALAETSLVSASRARADLNAVVKRLEQGSEEAPKSSGLERIVAITAEETNILWWIFGGRSRDTNETFGSFSDESIPFVAAKELADLTTLLPGPVAVRAFVDRVCESDRTTLPQTLAITATIKTLPQAFTKEVSNRWREHPCLPLCRLTREISGMSSSWAKKHKLGRVDMAQLFYRECLIARAWQNASL